jgi:hypothetical protein
LSAVASCDSACGDKGERRKAPLPGTTRQGAWCASVSKVWVVWRRDGRDCEQPCTPGPVSLVIKLTNCVEPRRVARFISTLAASAVVERLRTEVGRKWAIVLHTSITLVNVSERLRNRKSRAVSELRSEVEHRRQQPKRQVGIPGIPGLHRQRIRAMQPIAKLWTIFSMEVPSHEVTYPDGQGISPFRSGASKSRTGFNVGPGSIIYALKSVGHAVGLTGHEIGRRPCEYGLSDCFSPYWYPA